MTEQKHLFARHGLLEDLMLGLIVFLTIQSAQLFVMYGYITTMNMRFRFMVIPLVYVFAFLVIRRLRIKQLYMNACHAGFMVASFIVIFSVTGAGGFEKVAVGTSAAVQMIYSLKQRYRTEDFVVRPDILYVAVAVNIISFLVIAYHKKADFVSLILINTVLIVTFYFVARQNNVLDVSYYHSLRSEAQNVNSVKRQNRLSMIVIVLGIAVSLFLLYTFPVDNVTNALIAAISAFLRFILSRLPAGNTLNPDTTVEPDIDLPYEMSDGKDPILLKIIVLVVFLFLIVTFFISLVAAIRAFIAKYSTADDNKAADSDGAVIDLIENVDKSGRTRKDHIDFGKGYEKEIRKKFYHKVRKGMKAGLPIGKTSSPRQIERVLASEGDASISPLTDSYEKVRYGKEDLT